MTFPSPSLLNFRSPPVGAGNALSDLFVILLVVVVIVGAATGAPLVAALGALAVVVAVVARVWSRLSLEEVYYEREPSTDHAFLGDEIEVTFTLENRKPLPVPWVKVTDFVPLGLEVLDVDAAAQPFMGGTEVVETNSLGRYERVRIRHRLKAVRRGHYRMGPAHLQSGDLFGLYPTRRDEQQSRWSLVVYPRTVPMPGFILPSARPIGDARSPVRLWDDPTRPNGVREYRPGDPVRSIDWKTTARRGELFVRTYDPSVSQYAVILMDAVTTDKPWEGFQPEVLEAAVTGAASVAMHAIDSGYRVGLVSNGIPPGERTRNVIPPGRGAAQLPLIMESLAMVRPMTVRTVEELVESRGAEAMPFGATVIYVAGQFQRGAVDYVARLSSRGHPVILLHVGEGEAPDLPGLDVRDMRRLFGAAAGDSMFARPSARDEDLAREEAAAHA
ncbi:MAG: DUF58 domain-containing protein [Dehalococcoidia bacterium]